MALQTPSAHALLCKAVMHQFLRAVSIKERCARDPDLPMQVVIGVGLLGLQHETHGVAVVPRVAA